MDDILAMVYGDEIPEELRASFEWALSIGIGEHPFDKLEIVPLDSLEYPENLTGEELEPTISPTHWLVGNHSGNSGFKGGKSKGSIQIAVGSVESRFFISGIR